MALNLKAQATINLNTPGLRQFMKEFKGMQQGMQQLPKQWAAVQRTSVKALTQMAQVTKQITVNMRLATAQIRQFNAAAVTASNTMNRLSARGGFGGGNGWFGGGGGGGGGGRGGGHWWNRGGGLFSSRMVMRGASRGSNMIVRGGLPLGTMLGMGYLASAAGDDRREYMGTGTSYGVMKSFDTNFNRLVDARGLRHAIAEGQGDVTAPGYNSMRAMNIDPEGKSPEALGIEVMNTIRQNVKGKGRSEVGQYYHAKMLGGLSLNQEDVLRMSTESDENFEAFKKKHTKDTGDLDIQDPTMKRWQDLTVQFDTAWQTLKSGLLVGLEGLTPGVAALSRSLSESVATILKSDQVKLLMNAFGDGMKYVADNIDKESFRQGIKDFTDNIVVLSAKVIKALRLLHLIPGEVTEMGPPVSAGSMYQGDPTANKVWDAAGLPLTAGAGFLTAAVNATNRAAGPGGVMGMQQGWGNTLGGWIMNAGAKIDEWTGASVPLGKFAKQDMTDAEKVLMNTIINNETPGGGYRTEGKEFWDKDRRRMVHAVGRYQVMDYNVPAWTQELYGRSMTPEQFRADPLAQDTVALKRAMGYYQQTGNLADVLSKWHSGQLFADAVRMDLSDPNKTKTKDYVNKGLDYYARNSNGVVLQVSSSAAGNPVISASQMNLPAVGVPPLTLPGPPLFPGQIN